MPGDLRSFASVPVLLSRGEPLGERLAKLQWPQGVAPAPKTLRIFVQGLNTPRGDDPQGDIGADARLREYLRRGYLASPVLAIHNETNLERSDLPQPIGLRGWLQRRVRAALPLRSRDSYQAALLRFTRLGANSVWLTGEVRRLSQLLTAVLIREPETRLHLVGYSDGGLLIEHALRLAAKQLRQNLGAAQARVSLRQRVFVEGWGNTTPFLVRGPRRLLIHAQDDIVTSRSVLGRRLGVLSWSDVPQEFRKEVVLVTFASHYEGWNGHNALTAIGPALEAIARRELNQPLSNSSTAFEDAPTIQLYQTLSGRGERWRHYSPADLRIDFTRYAQFLWKSGAAAQEEVPRSTPGPTRPAVGGKRVSSSSVSRR
jgi:hypothetical protein